MHVQNKKQGRPVNSRGFPQWGLQKFTSRIREPPSRQPLVKGERLVRTEVGSAMQTTYVATQQTLKLTQRGSPPKIRCGAHLEKLREDPQDQLNGKWSSFQLANRTPPRSVVDRSIATSARMLRAIREFAPIGNVARRPSPC